MKVRVTNPEMIDTMAMVPLRTPWGAPSAARSSALGRLRGGSHPQMERISDHLRPCLSRPSDGSRHIFLESFFQKRVDVSRPLSIGRRTTIKRRWRMDSPWLDQGYWFDPSYLSRVGLKISPSRNKAVEGSFILIRDLKRYC
jgi:hypothetical protein